VENGARINLGDDFLNAAARIEANAESSLTKDEFAVVKKQLDNVMRNVGQDEAISGETYGNLIHKGSSLDAATKSGNSNIRAYAGQIKEALRDSLTTSLPPDEARAYQLARTQYKNLKTVEPLTLRADATGGPMPSTGDISPAALRAAVNRSFGSDIARAPPGSVPLNDLARIGQLLKEPPTSGTAERSSMLYTAAKAAELAGAAATGAYTGIVPAAVGLAAGVGGGRAVGSYLRSNWLANRLINNALQPSPGINPAFMNALQSRGVPAAVLAVNPLRRNDAVSQ